jgi:hypothetical protein
MRDGRLVFLSKASFLLFRTYYFTNRKTAFPSSVLNSSK